MVDIIQKTRDDYNKIARHFSGTRFDLWPELEQFKPLAQNGQTILDWGCGNGRLLLLFRDKAIKYFGVDISQGLLKEARKKYAADIKSGKARFFCVAHKERKFPANFFDLAFMVASFHHLPDRKSRLKLLQKIFKEMKAGGQLVITVWNLESDWAQAKLKKGPADQRGASWEKVGSNDYFIPWKNPQGQIEVKRYYHHFSREELSELVQTAGFAIERLDFYGKNSWADGKFGRNLVLMAKKV